MAVDIDPKIFGAECVDWPPVAIEHGRVNGDELNARAKSWLARAPIGGRGQYAKTNEAPHPKA
jgi:hypothetical protein